MEQGISVETLVLFVGFAALVVSAIWHRTRLDTEIEALPKELRDRLGWSNPGSYSRKQHRRRIANRLMLRGLPAWVPLTAQGRRHLMWLRVFGLGSGLYIAMVPVLAADAWGLLLFVGAPVVIILGAYGWLVGPWGGGQ